MPRTITEVVMWALGLLSVSLISYGVSSDVDVAVIVFPIAGAVVFGLTVFGVASYGTVSADPVSMAVPVRWGRRQPVFVREGAYFAAPFFPFLEEMLENVIQLKTVQLVFEEVRCMVMVDGQKYSGGTVRIGVAIAFIPDTDDIEQYFAFMNAGGQAGVLEALTGIVGESVRTIASDKEWDKIIFAKPEISAKLITLMTGEAPTDDTPEAIKEFIESILDGGRNDIRGLGIQISRINVYDIDTTGELRKVADTIVRENMERQGEQIDTTTMIARASLIIDEAKKRGETMLLKDALNFVQSDTGRAHRIIVDSQGSELLGASAIVGASRLPIPSAGNNNGPKMEGGTETPVQDSEPPQGT